MLKSTPMPRKTSIPIHPTEAELKQLEWRNKELNPPISLVRKYKRAEIVKMAAAGESNRWIARLLGVSRNTVKLWRYRFAREGLVGLKSRPIPGRPRKA